MLGPLSGRRGFRAGPLLGRRAEVVAQARPDSRARPARGTDPSVPGRSRAGLAIYSLRRAHAASPGGRGAARLRRQPSVKTLSIL
jgi:hypothetical protein